MSENENLNTTSSEISFKDIPFNSYKIFFICLIGVTFANLDHSIFILVSEKFQNEFGWSLSDVGWYVAITFFISGILCTQVGVLTDRIGRRKSLLWSTFLTPVFVAFLAIAPNTISVLIARTLGFTAAGAQSPITLTTVTESSPPRYRGLFTGILQIGFPLGWFFASVLVAFMIEQLDIRILLITESYLDFVYYSCFHLDWEEIDAMLTARNGLLELVCHTSAHSVERRYLQRLREVALNQLQGLLHRGER